MAYYGLRYPYVGKYDAANDTYAVPTLSARAIAFTVTPNYAEGSLAADDDANSEYDKEFTDADVNLGTDTIPDAWREDMFGNDIPILVDGNWDTTNGDKLAIIDSSTIEVRRLMPPTLITDLPVNKLAYKNVIATFLTTLNIGEFQDGLIIGIGDGE